MIETLKRELAPHRVLWVCLLIGVSFSTTYLPASPPLTPEPDVFPIGCFPGPPPQANTLSNWRSIKAAGFTVVCPVYSYDQQANLTMLQHCQEIGLKAVVNEKLIPPNAEAPLPPDWKQQVGQTVATYGDQKALFGYMLKDEPNADQFGHIRDVVAEFAARDSSHSTCVNLFPIYATAQQLGTSTYQEHLDRYLRTVNPAFLCYDHYTFLKDGTDRQDFFHNLELARETCARYGKPCWIVILAGWHEHFREPTDGEMRWQVYTSLAYGIKGIFYFTYWPVRDDYRAIVDYEGNPGPLYETVRQLNSEILQLGRTLLHLESKDVFHTGRSIPQGCTRLPDGMPISVSRDVPLVVGFLDDSHGSRHAMVVNRDCNRSVSVELRISRDVRSVWQISEKNGLATPVHLENRRATMILEPGGGVLLRLDS